MDNNHHHHHTHQPPQLIPAKSSRQRYNEWIFRDVPSDIMVELNGVVFALHKFPLVSRCGRIRKLVSEHRENAISKVELLSLPGGIETFEQAAKFCYGINFEITSSNVAQLCCIADYLEMTEDFSTRNLSSRANEYLDTVVTKNLEMSVEVLKQSENLLPLADDLNIVTRCIDAIASKACVEQIASSFSRLEYSSSGRLHMSRQVKGETDWWIKDLSVLRVDLYQRVMNAMKCRGVRPESIGESLMSYAEKELTSLYNLNGKKTGSHGGSSHEGIVVQTIVSLLPVEKLAVPLSFLFGLLRTAVMLDCTAACRIDLERRIGSQLDIATLDDLLIPSFRHADDTLFDVDVVHRILVSFSQQDDSDDEMEDGDGDGDGSGFESDGPGSPSQTALVKVSRLVDNYLAEIAPETNLKLSKFIAVAESLPAHARTVHDGLYRSIDVYLKAHQGLSEFDKKKLCKLIDFHKLSPEAGAHAAQNERLPLQSIVQVLYIEQLSLRNALGCSYPDDNHLKPPVHHQSWRINSGALSAAMSPKDNYASLRRENRELKLELTRLRMRLNDFEKEHVSMKRTMEKSNSRKFMSSFSKRIGKFHLFGHSSSSRGSSSPSRHSQRTDSKVTVRTE
ncbi:BTB/POZ domain-containing protein At5g48800 [Cynara cardunculus var. scolymus]|uniref:BTB/POZ domain-containing protein At5g48800 n=1 Tax=Cynara cardunculus var. scolymus TaxID=59895 RepID=UPI000D627278|nr:BTB/POZ domain-containing protein At5g48800 [Cynara cardunculus var. scolymus]